LKKKAAYLRSSSKLEEIDQIIIDFKTPTAEEEYPDQIKLMNSANRAESKEGFTLLASNL